MSTGFFADDFESKTPLRLLPECGRCGLWRTCSSPKMKPFGEGRRKILVCGEAPGSDEDDQGRPFVGRAGRLLRESLERVGIDLDRDFIKTNALTCRPVDNKITNPKAIDWCRPNLVRTINEVKPEIILVLGGTPIKSLIGWLWKEDIGSVGTWVGWQIPSQQLNAWVCITWHPSYISRVEGRAEAAVERLLFDRHLASMAELSGRPWKKVPDWAAQVRCLYNEEEVLTALRKVVKRNLPAAFDYETDRLKPDHPDASIYSCSVSDGVDTFAFPWQGKQLIFAMSEFLRSGQPKIASNIKFEERWTRRVLGHGVNGWDLDTMLGSHVLDTRPGITSIKFQAFIRFGQPGWDGYVKPFLKPKRGGSNEPNRIREADLGRVLVYNGIDSLAELKVAKSQKREGVRG